MAWESLRTNYMDAVFNGLRKYQIIENQDGTYSLVDVTSYEIKEEAFIGAKDINAMNTAMNLIMAALNNGTSLYDVFTQYFETQKQLFTENANNQNTEFQEYLDELEQTIQDQCEELQQKYTGEMTQFEEVQEAAFNEWFAFIKAQLTTDSAGKLLTEIQRVEGVLNEFIESEMDAAAVDALYDSVE